MEVYRILGFSLSLIGLTFALVKYINKVREDGSRANKEIYNHIQTENKDIYDHMEKKLDGIGSRIDKETDRINKLEIEVGRINQVDEDQEKQIGTLRTDLKAHQDKVIEKIDSVQDTMNKILERVAKIEQ